MNPLLREQSLSHQFSDERGVQRSICKEREYTSLILGSSPGPGCTLSFLGDPSQEPTHLFIHDERDARAGQDPHRVGRDPLVKPRQPFAGVGAADHVRDGAVRRVGGGGRGEDAARGGDAGGTGAT